MKAQNIFDEKTFFEGYRALRERDDNHNILIEQPAMACLLPNMVGKTVLDLGCGCGENCIDFVHRGAKHVLGIDISNKMLEVARSNAAHPSITYRNMDMCLLDELDSEPLFDLVYSSLAFHYIEDFDKLCADIYMRLLPGGTLLFSQEHPLNTAEGFYNKNEDGSVVSYTVFNYNRPRKREVSWFVDGVVKFHRPMAMILNALSHAGFIIEEVCEPVPQPWALQKRPALIKEWTKPCFLIIRARKP